MGMKVPEALLLEVDMAELSIQIDDDLKTRAEQVFDHAGISMATALTLFLNQVVVRRKLPFSLPKTPEPIEQDPIYNPAMMRRLRQSIEHAKQGKFVVKTMEELRRMENG
jgi:DNA-damage-inducible protein J